MIFKICTPREYINPFLSAKSISQNKFDSFCSSLVKYLKNIAEQVSLKQSEPNIVTNALKPFFESLEYDARAHSQMGQSGIDLALYDNGRPSVIVEAKKPLSKEMVDVNNFNKKSFHEALLYFMRELSNGNKTLCHVILTDFYSWFVFDAKDLYKIVCQNKNIQLAYKNYSSAKTLGDNTRDFYVECERALGDIFMPSANGPSLPCAHFSLHAELSKKELTSICKLLSRECLFKTFNPNDANSLNENFYSELLYILGLEERKTKNKKTISASDNPQSGSLYENIKTKLLQYNKPADFESIIKLIIIWVNRILFLKLLESQIVRWNTESCKFLARGKFDTYDKLDMLFFEILSKEPSLRSTSEFDNIPYLNSSLFEIHADEKNGITIAALSDDFELDYFEKTVLKDDHSSKKSGKVKSLYYLIDFLDCYDFANDSKNEVVAESKALITASVLGLFFEKINGYKDGSYYTPSAITMYMTKGVIEKAVLNKFNGKYGWSCKSLVDLYNKIENIDDANSLINELRICDPAVGSGHFLVSALNEILRIKSELGILIDNEGRRIKDYKITVENDELILRSVSGGELFEYNKDNSESARVQKAIFNEKQSIIENSLFGVDINPNSVNICRLRLWIELLKNAYYKEDGRLDTLPNIDINIKCGNSLVSRFDINDRLKAKGIGREIENYKEHVFEYKGGNVDKSTVLNSIVAIKMKFSKILEGEQRKALRLIALLREYVRDFGYNSLPDELALKAIKLGLGQQFQLVERKKSNSKKLNELLKVHKELLEIEGGKFYENAFEWRFEFPEIIDSDGNFIGFDIVLANPPYIDSETMVNDGLEALRDYIVENYNLAVGNWDIYIPFFEKALAIAKPDGIIAFITPDKWLTKPFGSALRSVYSSKITSILRAGSGIFDSARVDSIITMFDKSGSDKIEAYTMVEGAAKFVRSEQIDSDGLFSFDLLFSEYAAILKKIRKLPLNLNSVAVCENACATSDAYKLKDIIFDGDGANDPMFLKIINTGTIDKYISKYGIKPMTYLKDKYLFPVVDKNKFLTIFPKTYGEKSLKPKIIGKGLTLLDWCIDSSGEFVPGKTTLVVLSDDIKTLKFLLGVLNSQFAFFYIANCYASSSYNGGIVFTKEMINDLPLPSPSGEYFEPIVELVDKIVDAKKTGETSAELESILNKLVFKLYDVSAEEALLIQQSISFVA